MKYSWKLPQFFVPSNYSLAQKWGSMQVGLTLARDLSPETEKSVAYEGYQKRVPHASLRLLVANIAWSFLPVTNRQVDHE